MNIKLKLLFVILPVIICAEFQPIHNKTKSQFFLWLCFSPILVLKSIPYSVFYCYLILLWETIEINTKRDSISENMITNNILELRLFVFEKSLYLIFIMLLQILFDRLRPLLIQYYLLLVRYFPLSIIEWWVSSVIVKYCTMTKLMILLYSCRF